MKNKITTISLLCIFILYLLFIQTSCKKESTNQNNVTSNCIGPQPKMQFKANRVLYSCDAIFDSRLGWADNIPTIGYDASSGGLGGLSGSFNPTSNFPNGGGIDIIFRRPIPPPLTVGTYNSLDQLPGGTDGSFGNCGNFTINISRVSNGTADGTFYGTVWESATPNQVITISEGVFSNVIVER